MQHLHMRYTCIFQELRLIVVEVRNDVGHTTNRLSHSKFEYHSIDLFVPKMKLRFSSYWLNQLAKQKISMFLN